MKIFLANASCRRPEEHKVIKYRSRKATKDSVFRALHFMKFLEHFIEDVCGEFRLALLCFWDFLRSGFSGSPWRNLETESENSILNINQRLAKNRSNIGPSRSNIGSGGSKIGSRADSASRAGLDRFRTDFCWTVGPTWGHLEGASWGHVEPQN